MIEVKGKNGIIARIIADSVTANGKRFTTFEWELPRLILAEVNTHRMLSKNTSSSRAIPLNAAIENIQKNPAFPVYWGKNQAGMSASEELTGEALNKAYELWQKGIDQNIALVREFQEVGLHKQTSARFLETGQLIRSVISGTEWENLWWLRDHSAAQPEFQELARVAHQAYKESVPQMILVSEWHLPYITSIRNKESGEMEYFDSDGTQLTLENAQKISASCCAQVSYRKNDTSLEKALDIYEKLVGMDRAHSSPFEHAGTPIPLNTVPFDPSTWPQGVTHVTKEGQLGSGNLRGWIQYRQLIPNHTKW